MSALDDLKPTILTILRTSDLGSVSTKEVRSELQQNPSYSKLVPMGLAVDGVHKHQVNALIKRCFAEIQVESGNVEYLAAPVVVVAATTAATAHKRSRKNKKTEAIEDKPAPKKRRVVSPETKAKRAQHPNNAFSAPLTLDEPLADLCGAQDIPRYDIIRRIWAYIKSNKLQDPEHKRTIIIDDKLRAVIPQDRIDSFEVAKYIGAHVTRKPKVESSATPASPASTSPTAAKEEGGQSPDAPMSEAQEDQESESKTAGRSPDTGFNTNEEDVDDEEKDEIEDDEE